MTDRFRDRLRRLFAAPTSGCPLVNCSTCQPVPAPLDVVAEQERCIDVAMVSSWLIEALPEVWHDKPLAEINGFAERLLVLRKGIEIGWWRR